MEQPDVMEVRRQNLRSLIAEKYQSVNASFSRAVGKDANYVNLILTSNPQIRRNMGEKFAREVEKLLGLPVMWFDTPRVGGPVERVTEVPIVRLDALDRAGLEKVVFGQDVISQHIERPTAEVNLRAVYALDGEMSPSITKGDLLFVDTGVHAFDKPGVYIIVRDKDVFIRRVTKLLTGGIRISADGLDAALDAEADQFACSGRVIGLMRFSRI